MGKFQLAVGGEGYYPEPISYVMLWVQFPGIPSYDEDWVALFIRDQSEFGQRVPVVIGTPTIDWVVQALKESELETIPDQWPSEHMSMSMASLP